MMGGWWCGAEWLSYEKIDLGGISWDCRRRAAGEDFGKGLSLVPAEQPDSWLGCSAHLGKGSGRVAVGRHGIRWEEW